MTTSSAETGRSRRRSFAGGLLIIMLGLTIVDVPVVLPAALAWLAAATLWPDANRIQRNQIIWMSAAAVVGLIWGWWHQVEIDPLRVLSQNQLIISMMAAVTLLRLLSHSPESSTEELPRGKGAFLKSMLGVHLFGAVINISALVIMADRLSHGRSLTRSQALLLSRTFTMAVFYSPFIGGMALALAYTPGSNLPTMMGFGIPLAIAGMFVIRAITNLENDSDLDDFRGYPVRLESLWLPGLLAMTVLVLHSFFPSVSVLTLIIMFAPVIVVVALVHRSGPRAATRELSGFVPQRLPDMSGELFLFLAAGVLASGVAAVFATLGDWVPFDRFDAGAASLILIGTVVVAFVGVHPVVVVSTAVPLLSPLAPDPSFLGILFVMCWGIGCAISPLSGTNVTLDGRYGVNSWFISRRNAGFCTVMTVIAIGLLFAYELVLPTSAL